MDNLNHRLKYKVEDIINLNEFQGHDNVIICNTCNSLALKPYLCESCKFVFCLDCINQLSTSICPICTKVLMLCNQKYFEFFENLKVKCPSCSTILLYNQISNHKCPEFKDEIKLINNIICFKCTLCHEFISYSEKFNHLNECNKNFQSINDKINDLKIKELDEKQITLNPDLGIIENILKNFIKELKFTNLNDLVTTISTLNISINNLLSINNTSFCNKCSKVMKKFSLTKCKCCSVDFCLSCVTPCLICKGIYGKNCLTLCKNCNVYKCPDCDFDFSNTCFCIDNKLCKVCSQTVSNNLSFGLQKSIHLECKYVRIVENNVYIIKYDERLIYELFINSQRQSISLSIIKDREEILSKIFQINNNEKLIIDSISIKGEIDSWVFKNKFDCDYIIINFNSNPNYSMILNKLNNISFFGLPYCVVNGKGPNTIFKHNIGILNNINIKKI